MFEVKYERIMNLRIMWCQWYSHRDEKRTKTWNRTISQYSSQSHSHPLRRCPFISTSIEKSKRSEAQRLNGPNITETWLLLFFQIFCINDFTIRQEGFPTIYILISLIIAGILYIYKLIKFMWICPCIGYTFIMPIYPAYTDLWSLSSSKSLINFLL